MSARVQWTGLSELRDALRELPAELADEAGGIVLAAAEAAKAEIAAAYPVHTGNLRKGLKIGTGKAIGRFGASVILKNNAPHAWIYENGTQTRQYNGANRGVMPPAPPGRAFVPAVIRHRRAMHERLIQMLIAHGLTVRRG